jgi:ankyrin repeat protein
MEIPQSLLLSNTSRSGKVDQVSAIQVTPASRFEVVDLYIGRDHDDVPGMTQEDPSLLIALQEKAKKLGASVNIHFNAAPQSQPDGKRRLVVIWGHGGVDSEGEHIVGIGPNQDMRTGELVRRAGTAGATHVVVFACKDRRAASAIVSRATTDSRHLPITLLVGGRQNSQTTQNAADILQMVDWAITPGQEGEQPDELEMFLNHLSSSPQSIMILRQDENGGIDTLHAPALSKKDFKVVPQTIEDVVSRRLDKVAKKDPQGATAFGVERLRPRWDCPTHPLGETSREAMLRHRIYRGDTWAVEAIIESDEKIDINATDIKGRSLLMTAAARGRLDVVKLLINKEAVPDCPGRDGNTPLSVACQKGHLDVVEFLIKKSATLNRPDNYGMTPLYAACQYDHAPVVEFLIARNANVDVKAKDGTTPLFIASQEGNLEVVELLLEKGAHLDWPDEEGNTPLLAACDNGHEEVVEALINAGADANQPINVGLTVLYMASHHGYVDLVRLLLKANAKVDEPMPDGTTPLSQAGLKGHKEIVNLLILAGAKPIQQGSDDSDQCFTACQIL